MPVGRVLLTGRAEVGFTYYRDERHAALRFSLAARCRVKFGPVTDEGRPARRAHRRFATLGLDLPVLARHLSA